MRVAIVGGGIMGLCSAWALAKAGHETAVYDQGSLPHPLASSFDDHRLIREPYGALSGYARMALDAYGAWDELFHDLGVRPYEQTGTLVMASGSDRWVRDSAASLAALGVEVEWLEAEELDRRAPLLRHEGVSCAFSLPTGGVLLAGRILAALAGHLARSSTEIHEGRPVTEVDPHRGRLVVGGKTVEADVLLVAAGAWTPRLLPTLAGRLTPSRQAVVYLDPPGALREAWASSPLVLDIDPETGFYLVPPVSGTPLKIGDHRFSLRGDPDDPRDMTPEEARPIHELCERRLRDFHRYGLARARACYYTVAPGERFVLEPLGRSWVLSACSGHGFKFAPLIALRLAEVLSGRQTAADIVRWAAGEDPR